MIAPRLLSILSWVIAATSIACSGEPSAPAQGSTGAAEAPASVSASSSASASPAAAKTTEPAADPGPNPVYSGTKKVSIWIKGGTVVDGTGAKRRRADVLVDDEKIVFVGDVPKAKADKVIDATGLVVAPGFVDTHSHTEPTGSVDHLLAQGVTTILVGQDGNSPDSDIGTYLNRMSKKKLRVNVATLVGHGTARGVAKIGAKNDVSAKDLERLARVVEEAMEDGAFGLSTGLEYTPGRLAKPEELAAIAKPVAKHGGVVMSHMRSEDDDKIEAALDELLAQCAASGAKAHVAHVKIVLGRGEDRARQILAKLQAARDKGLSVTADVYPYTASYTTLSILFPDFARPPNDYKQATKERTDELLKYLRDRITTRNGPKATLFGTGRFAGKTLEEAAKQTGKPFEEVLMDFGPNGGSAAYFVMDEDVMKVFLADPFVMFGTDGSGNSSHPRGYGTFAKVLDDYTDEGGVITLEQFVRKASALPATTLGLPNQGTIQVGAFADIVMFAPDEIEDRATFLRPRIEAKGMRHVIVGGEIEWKDGSAVKKGKGGRALRRR